MAEKFVTFTVGSGTNPESVSAQDEVKASLNELEENGLVMSNDNQTVIFKTDNSLPQGAFSDEIIVKTVYLDECGTDSVEETFTFDR